MQVADLLANLRTDILDDPNTPYLWSDAFLLAALDRAQKQACNRRDLIYDASTASYGDPAVPLCAIPLVPGQQGYTLDSHWTHIENLVVDGTVLVKRSLEEMDRKHGRTWRTALGKVSEYVQRLYTVQLVAIPTIALSGQNLQVEGWRLPLVTLNATNLTPEIPEEFHDDLKWWAAHEAYNKRDAETYNPQRVVECLANFERIFGPPVPAGVRLNQFNEPRSATPRPADYLPPKRSTRWAEQDERNW